MEELSIEEKAKAYDEAIERAKKINIEHSKCGFKPSDDVLYIFPELAESENDRIRKEIINFLELPHPQFVGKRNHEKWIAWLEKKREQKSVDKIESKFKIEKNKWYICIRELYDAYNNRIFTKGNIYHSIKDETLMPDNSNVPYEIKYCPDHYFRLWTVQDIKDGDVLYCIVDSIEYIVMNKGVNRYDNIDSYFRYNSFNGFGVDIPSVLSTEQDNIAPATKEQRDLLFQKMKETGYEWDAENKQLRKIESKQEKLTEFEKSVKQVMEEAIECGDTHNLKADADMLLRLVQKPTEWTEEDEEHLNSIISDIKTDMGAYPRSQEVIDIYNDDISFLKSLKNRVQPQSMQEWSEEDEINLGKAIWYVENPVPMVAKDSMLVEWLKSLKARVQPQNGYNPYKRIKPITAV